ncbi:hypothetical protein OC845_000386 [Tilletia horrida]|nr:hypothetical protein OC845_000386 [Tilletia horrida]
MSYASVAKHDAPAPTAANSDLLEGSYNVAPTDGHGAADVPSNTLPDVNSHKVNVVPAGTDLHNLHTQTEQTANEAEQRARQQASQAKKQAQQGAEKVEQKASQVSNDAKAGLDKAGQKASELSSDAKSGLDKAGKKLHQAGQDAKAEFNKAEKKVSNAAKDASREAERSWNEFSSDPKKWASSLSAFNIAVIGGLGVLAYTKRDVIKTWDRKFIATIVGGVAAVVGLQAYFGTQKAQEQTGRK